MKNFYYKKNYSMHDNAAKLFTQLNFNYAQKQHNVNLNHAALLIIDMQNYFLDKNSHAVIPASAQIINNIFQLQEKFLAHNFLCLQTLHIDKTNQKMQSWWGENINHDNIYLKLQNSKINIIKKSTYDAFWQTDLENILHTHNIKQLIITGLTTHLCCDTTARAAFIRGFDVFLVLDAVCAHNKKINNNSIINLAHGFAAPILSSNIF